MPATFLYLKSFGVGQELHFLGVDSDLELETIGGSSRKADLRLKTANF